MYSGKKAQHDFPKMRGGEGSKAVWNFSKNSSVLETPPFPKMEGPHLHFSLLPPYKEFCLRGGNSGSRQFFRSTLKIAFRHLLDHPNLLVQRPNLMLHLFNIDLYHDASQWTSWKANNGYGSPAQWPPCVFSTALVVHFFCCSSAHSAWWTWLWCPARLGASVFGESLENTTYA